jgi:hypothetical protein
VKIESELVLTRRLSSPGLKKSDSVSAELAIGILLLATLKSILHKYYQKRIQL